MAGRLYYIAFDTKDMKNRIVGTTVTLGTDIVKDMNKKLPVNLSEDPLYPALVRYVLNNPPRSK